MVEHKNHLLGIDGSDYARAHLYFRFIQGNFEYLDRYFRIYALKYYVRITRFGKAHYDDPFDFNDILPQMERINKSMEAPRDFMYNYFLIDSKKKPL